MHSLEKKYSPVLNWVFFAFWFALNNFSPALNAAVSEYFKLPEHCSLTETGVAELNQ